jgi:enamine deaminase RidA (YjgF/YER057c/UK114 family)
MTSSAIQKGLTVHVHRSGAARVDIVVSFPEPESAARAAEAAYRVIARALDDCGASTVHERVFGSLAVEPMVRSARRRLLPPRSRGAVTFVEGSPAWGEGLSGILIHAVVDTAAQSWDIVHDGLRCGRAWREGDATCFVVQDLTSDDLLASPEDQLHQVIERAAKVLEGQGASFRDVVRTWFYVEDILGWYPGFNAVRNDAYRRFGVLSRSPGETGLIPASTAVRGANPKGSMVVLDLMAVHSPKHAPPLTRRLSSGRQPEATRYGSAFSRAVTLKTLCTDIIHVSGTAAIDSLGASVHGEDVAAQASYTLDAIEALIAPVGAGLGDIRAASIFVKRPEDAESVWGVLADRGLDDFPGVCLVADICRDELLVEIDAEVALQGARPGVDPGGAEP